MQENFFFQAEDGIRDYKVTGVQTCALPISPCAQRRPRAAGGNFPANAWCAAGANGAIEARGNDCHREIRLAGKRARVEERAEAKRKFEVAYLTKQLSEHRWNVSRTAATVGLHRQSLQEKLRELGIRRPGRERPEEE